MADPMTLVTAARKDFERAQEDAKKLIDRARAKYGRSIKEARDRDHLKQDAISDALGLSRESVRRYERYYDEWVEKYGADSLGD